MEEEFEPITGLDLQPIANCLGNRGLSFAAELGFHSDASLYILTKVKHSVQRY
jgi:hypothetical protein